MRQIWCWLFGHDFPDVYGKTECRRCHSRGWIVGPQPDEAFKSSPFIKNK